MYHIVETAGVGFVVPDVVLRYVMYGNHCSVCELESFSLSHLLTASASQVVQPLAGSEQAVVDSEVVPAGSTLVEETTAEGVTCLVVPRGWLKISLESCAESILRKARVVPANWFVNILLVQIDYTR